MSMVDTWSIWMATLSFMTGSFLGCGGRLSVKPAAQFLQQGRRPLAQVGIAVRPLHAQESLEGGDGGPAVVQARIELAGLEKQFRPVRRDRQHALERLRGARPVLSLGQ